MQSIRSSVASVARTSLTRAASRRTVFRRRVLNAGTGDVAYERTNKLQNRLEEQFIFEIFKDGGRGYKNLSVRALYTYVVKAITENPEAKSVRLRKTVIANVAAAAAARNSMLGVVPESMLQQGLQYQKAPEDEFFRGPGKKKLVLEDSEEFTTEEQQPDSPPSNKPEGGGQVAAEAPPEVVDDVEVTYRERLGGFLHPRDIRKLFVPFSATTEPEIIVRRHVILLNFDTLRAIILRDRLLVFVPQGADSILDDLEKRVRTGFVLAATGRSKDSSSAAGDHHGKKGSAQSDPKAFHRSGSKDSVASLVETEPDQDDYFDREWNELKKGEKGEGWIDLPFELRCIDAVLETVAYTFLEDGNTLMDEAEHDMQNLLDTGSLNGSLVRHHKDKLIGITTRVQAFSRALNLVLDHNEDLALMNLSRLLSNPERFIQPVPEAILNEESDEPELILEAHLQETNTLINELELTNASIISTQEELNQRSDTVRNRLLYTDMILSIVALNVACASLIGAYMGMNVTNHMEDDPQAFLQIVIGTTLGGMLLLILLVFFLSRSGVLPSVHEL